MALKDQMTAYLAKLREQGVRLLKFPCPHCEALLETEANTTNRDWDTASECWECNRMFMKITPANGEAIKTVIPPRR